MPKWENISDKSKIASYLLKDIWLRASFFSYLGFLKEVIWSDVIINKYNTQTAIWSISIMCAMLFDFRQVGGGGSEGEQSAWWPGFGAEVSRKASRHRSSSQQTIRLQEQTTHGAVSELPGYSSHSNLSLGWNELEISGNKMEGACLWNKGLKERWKGEGWVITKPVPSDRILPGTI